MAPNSTARLAAMVIALVAGAGGVDGTSCDMRSLPCALGAERFNQLALRRNLPLVWAHDSEGVGTLEPRELSVLLFYPGSGEAWIRNGHFTYAFREALADITYSDRTSAASDLPHQRARQALDETVVSVVATDRGSLSFPERRFLDHMVAASAWLDALYERQTGTPTIRRRIEGDSELTSALRLDRGTHCYDSSIDDCIALDGRPAPQLDVYPSRLPIHDLCSTLARAPDARELLSEWTAVRYVDDRLVGISYERQYADLIGPLARELRAAALGLGRDDMEPALAGYLDEVARALETGEWPGPRDSFDAGGDTPSRWYVRIRAVQMPRDPCAGVKLALGIVVGRVDEGRTRSWNERPWPGRRPLEEAISSIVGDAYVAASSEPLPIAQIVHPILAAGALRRSYELARATTTRHHTALMPDVCDARCQNARTARTQAILDAPSAASSGAAELLSTHLHEVAHLIGPGTHGLRTASAGPRAEAAHARTEADVAELHAQVAAAFLVNVLAQRGVISSTEARDTYAVLIAAALGRLPSHPSPHDFNLLIPGYLFAAGALLWSGTARTADGRHQGAFHVVFSMLPDVLARLEAELVRILIEGDERPLFRMLAAAGASGIPTDWVGERAVDSAGVTVEYSIR